MYLLALHPILQIFTVATVFYVFGLGVRRFLQLHMRKKMAFPWNKHVFWGKAAIILVILGYMSGLTAVYRTFLVFGFTGVHQKIAAGLVPLLLFGFGSGLFMDSRKKKRSVLNLLHGGINLIVVLLFVLQGLTGFRLVILYFFGR